jgi:hypothetical protein
MERSPQELNDGGGLQNMETKQGGMHYRVCYAAIGQVDTKPVQRVVRKSNCTFNCGGALIYVHRINQAELQILLQVVT